MLLWPTRAAVVGVVVLGLLAGGVLQDQVGVERGRAQVDRDVLSGRALEFVAVDELAGGQRVVTRLELAVALHARGEAGVAADVDRQQVAAGLALPIARNRDLVFAVLGQVERQQRPACIAFEVVVVELLAAWRSHENVGIEIGRAQVHDRALAAVARERVAVGVLTRRERRVAFLELAVLQAGIGAAPADGDSTLAEQRAAIGGVVVRIGIDHRVGAAFAFETRVVALAVTRPLAAVVAEVGLRLQGRWGEAEASGKRSGG